MLSINSLNLLSWFISGLLVGLIVYKLDNKSYVKGGKTGTVMASIAGAIIASYFAYTVLGMRITGFNMHALIIAIIGAVMFAAIERFIFKETFPRTYNMYGFKGGRVRRRKVNF